MERIYAQALWDALEAGTPSGKAVTQLKKMLEERGREALLPKIARAFSRLAQQRGVRDRLTLTVARQKEAARAIKKVEKLLTELNITDVDLCEEVDETLIGGWRLEGHGILVDESWKKSLLSIYNRATS